MSRISKSGEKESRLGLLRVEGGSKGDGEWLLRSFLGFLPGGTEKICRLQWSLNNPVNLLKQKKTIALYPFEWVNSMVCKLCLIKLLKNPLVIYMCHLYFQTLFLSVCLFTQMSHCLDYCGFIIYLESGNVNPLTLLFFFKVVLAIIGPVTCIWILESVFTKEACRNFYCDCTASVAQFGDRWYLHIAESSDLWRRWILNLL